jgi:hypothetical protein
MKKEKEKEKRQKAFSMWPFGVCFEPQGKRGTISPNRV